MTRVRSTLNRQPSETIRGVDSHASAITVLYVGEASAGAENSESEQLAVPTALDEIDRFTVLRESRPEAVLTRLEEVDCLLLECSTTSTAAGLELLTAVTAREPALPVVFVPRELSQLESDTEASVAEASDDESESDDDEGQTDCDRPTTVDVLEQQISRAVEHRRAATLARRALFAVETASEGVAIVTPTGTIEFVNHAYSRQFGYDPEELRGRSWTDVYTDGEVDHLETTAIPAVEDGWRWAGNCVGRRKDGNAIAVQTEIIGLEDDSLVFTVHEAGGSHEPLSDR